MNTYVNKIAGKRVNLLDCTSELLDMYAAIRGDYILTQFSSCEEYDTACYEELCVFTDYEDVAVTCSSTGSISVSDSITCSGIGGLISFLDTDNINITTPDDAVVVGEGAITVVVSGTGTLELPAGTLLHVIVFLSDSTGTASVGTTLGGDNIIGTTVTAGTPSSWTLNYYISTTTTIYFTGSFTTKVYTQ